VVKSRQVKTGVGVNLLQEGRATSRREHTAMHVDINTVDKQNTSDTLFMAGVIDKRYIPHPHTIYLSESYATGSTVVTILYASKS